MCIYFLFSGSDFTCTSSKTSPPLYSVTESLEPLFFVFGIESSTEICFMSLLTDNFKDIMSPRKRVCGYCGCVGFTSPFSFHGFVRGILSCKRDLLLDYPM